MIYLSDNLIEIQHLGLGKYSGVNFKTLIIPKRIQTIRVQGPNVYLDGPYKDKKTYQVIYSYKGYTESFVIEDWEYIRIMIFLSLGYEGLNYYMTHDDDNIKRFEEKALNGRSDGEHDPNPGLLVAYIKEKLTKEG